MLAFIVKSVFRVILMGKEYGILPDFIFRFIIRLMCTYWCRNLYCGGDVENQNYYKMKFIDKLRNSPTTVETKRANEQHYEVPSEFYTEVLGDLLKYSCCLYSSPKTTLNDAEEAMLAMVVERARIENKPLKVLDLGCGWGSTSFFLAKHYPKLKITALSNSKTQKAFIDNRAKELGLDKQITVITADVGLYDTADRYDRIISVEMFEHVRNYAQLFAKVGSWLAPGGYLFVHILGNRQFAYEFKTDDDDWMGKHFFAGGTMPSEDLFMFFTPKDLTLEHIWRVSGTHYKRTLDAWLKKLDNKATTKKAMAILKGDPSGTSPKLAVARWRIFFMFCAEVFGYKNGSEWLVIHYLFHKQA
eukprot:NODE_3355_length_1235_cov_120.188849_g3184_i0.p1 GENE.NODE_3355_length_1235_cov_120.188849_g3184_i0~~NODE_3355_length_1235_cov_120.188849_g3184_i0.p1  ORF type:complete len:359 (-),score=78.44 NODE_3355_length_1235_cov_120.188849_g3184_i0:94-1170(-)